MVQYCALFTLDIGIGTYCIDQKGCLYRGIRRGNTDRRAADTVKDWTRPYPIPAVTTMI